MSEQPVTPDRLAEIQQRADAATKGFWIWRHFGDDPGEPCRIVMYPADGSTFHVVADEIWQPADAEFIAHAREDIPFLLAELARYQAAVQAAVRFVDQVAAGEHSFGPWPGMGDFFRAEMAQLIGSDAGWIAEHLGDER